MTDKNSQDYSSDLFRMKLIEHVENERRAGRKLSDILPTFKIPRSTYYVWLKRGPGGEAAIDTLGSVRRPNELAPSEEKMILDCHNRNPHLRHRQIQGLIQLAGHYISPSSVLKVLKKNNRVEGYFRRPSPLKVPVYEAYRSNLLWCEDWTKILVNWTKWHLLVIIDAFSRKIVAWELVPQVNSTDISNIYKKALANEKIEKDEYPKLRADRGSPNTSHYTKAVFEDLGAIISFAQVRRPTENARIERFFGTIKQEETYLAVNYLDEKVARESIAEYIDYYNNHRPHQALWNFTPQHCHETNNNSLILQELRELKRKSLWLRLELNGSRRDNQFIERNLKLLKKYQSCAVQQNI